MNTKPVLLKGGFGPEKRQLGQRDENPFQCELGDSVFWCARLDPGNAPKRRPMCFGAHKPKCDHTVV